VNHKRVERNYLDEEKTLFERNAKVRGEAREKPEVRQHGING